MARLLDSLIWGNGFFGRLQVLTSVRRFYPCDAGVESLGTRDFDIRLVARPQTRSATNRARFAITSDTRRVTWSRISCQELRRLGVWAHSPIPAELGQKLEKSAPDPKTQLDESSSALVVRRITRIVPGALRFLACACRRSAFRGPACAPRSASMFLLGDPPIRPHVRPRDEPAVLPKEVVDFLIAEPASPTDFEVELLWTRIEDDDEGPTLNGANVFVDRVPLIRQENNRVVVWKDGSRPARPGGFWPSQGLDRPCIGQRL